MLKQDSVQFSIIPVFSYQQLAEKTQPGVISEDVRSVLFFNCGGVYDWTEHHLTDETSEVTLYIFDSHRPIQHKCIHSSKNIVIVDDGKLPPIDQIPDDNDLQMANQDEDEAEDEFDAEAIANETEEKRERQDEVDASRLKKERKQIAQDYYSSYSTGNSVAGVMYQLSVELNRQSVDFFWLWVIGLSDQFAHSKIGQESYDEELQYLTQAHFDVSKGLVDRDDVERPEQAVEEKKFDKNDLFYREVDLETDNKPVGTIFQNNEFKFMLLRQWSLYDAIDYSSFMCSSMKLWTEHGRRELDKFIAHLGIPVKECKQKFTFMEAKHKQALNVQIYESKKLFGIGDLTVGTFVRQLDNKTQLSGIDLVQSVSSILEYPYKYQKELPGEKKRKKPEEEEDVSVEIVKEAQMSNFWMAYDALSSSAGNMDLVKSGIELAKESQMAIMNQGKSLLARKKIIRYQYFHLVEIDKDDLRDSRYFLFPQALTRLGLFLIEARKREKSRSTSLPVLISVKNAEKSEHIVAGIIGPDSEFRDTDNRNDFGVQFETAADKIGAHIEYHGFETHVMKIEEKNYAHFIQHMIGGNQD